MPGLSEAGAKPVEPRGCFDDLDLRYEINGWQKKRDSLGRLVPPEVGLWKSPRRL